MKMADFKALPIEEQITRLNKHLLHIKDMPGRLEDHFKTGEFEFSYSLLRKNLKTLGLAVDGKTYTVSMLGGKPQQNVVKSQQDEKKQEDVMLKQNNVEQQQVTVKQDVVKQTSSEVVEPQQSLTNDEIAFLKQLFKEHKERNNDQQFIVNGKPMLVLPTMVGAKKTTGVSVYIEQWERWAQFKSKYNMYSGTDLLAMALQEFMDKYGDDE